MEPVRLFKTLSDETRLRILGVLDGNELSVNEIVEILGSTQSRISRHLTVLKDAVFLDSRREGTWVYYRRPDEESMPAEIRQCWELVREWSRGRKAFKGDQKKVQEVLRRRRDRTQQFYGEHANRWDSIRETLCGDMATFQALESLIPPSLVVADVGTGTGQLLVPLAKVVRRVIGVDHSPEMLRLAETHVKKEGLTNVDLRQGEMENLPLRRHEVDAVFASLVLHHAADPAKAIHEMARVVKPGGSVTVIDLQSHNEEWMREEWAHVWLGFEKKDVQRWFEKAGLADGRWMEGLPPSPQENTRQPNLPVRSFVFYARKRG